MRKIMLLVFVILALLFSNLVGEENMQASQFATNRPDPIQVEPVAPASSGQSGITDEDAGNKGDAYSIAINAFNKERYYKAIDYFEQVDPKDPNYGLAMDYLAKAKKIVAGQLLAEAQSQFAAGDYKGALESLEEAIGYAPDLQQVKDLQKRAQQKFDEANRKELKAQMSQEETGKGISFSVLQVQTRQSAGGLTAPADKTFLFVKLQLTNKSKQLLRIIPNNFTLATSDGGMSSIDFSTYELPDYLRPSDLQPGQSTSGWLVYHSAKRPQYTLIYSGFDEQVTKTVVP